MSHQYIYRVSLGMSLLLLFIAWSAWATAPRISAQMFGEETRADIVAYQPASADTKLGNEGAVALELMKEAFAAAGKSPVVDVLPSAQLARYALANHDAPAMVGEPGDIPTKDAAQYSIVVFYLKGDVPVALIFAKDDTRAEVLRAAFNQGLQKILKKGKYLETLEKNQGKGHVPADYDKRLKRHNSNLK